MTDRPAPEPLRVALADRYTVERELGQGGMATVYLAHDLKHDRKVAIKVLRPELAAVIGADRFLAEIKTTANLQHPHILSLFDSGTVNGTVFYVMPFVDGESLRDRLMREKQLPITDALRIATETADALQYAHQHGVIHRDIKPENILLHGGHALVADFGIALAASKTGATRMTETGMSLGTPQYMSPEQAMGERDLDARSDVYALGAVTYEMLTGAPPFSGPTVQAIVAKILTDRPSPIATVRDTVPASVEHAVLRALAKLPADRWATAADFADALRSDAPHQLTAVSTLHRRSARSRVSTGLGAACLILLGITGWALQRTPVAPSRMFDAALPDSAPMSSAPDVNATGYGTGIVNLTVAGNGDFVVYPVRHGDSTTLWYRSLIDASAHPIAGTAGGTTPRISPDGTRLAFVSANRVLIMPVQGGDAKLLLQADAPPTTLDWVTPTRLLAIANDGITLRWLDSEVGASDEKSMTVTLKTRCYFGRWVASQKRLLCSQGQGVFEDISTGTTQPLRARNADGSPGSSVVTGQSFRIVDDRYIMYVGVDGDVRAAPYDPRTDLIGRSISLVSGVKIAAAVAGQLDLTQQGMLAFVPGSPASDERMVMLRPGQEPSPLPIEQAHFQRFDLTRDGHRLAAVVITPQGHELRLYDLKTGQHQTWLRAEYIGSPFWDQKGDSIVVRTWNGTRAAILRGSPDAASPPDTVYSASSLSQVPEPTDYHDDANLLARGATDPYPAIRIDLTRHPAVFDSLIPGAVFAQISPDGHRLVWQSQYTGQLNLTSYPPGPRQQLVAAGGVEPLWLSPSELLFRSGATWNLVHIGADGAVGSPERWGTDPRFLDTPGWSNRVSWNGGIIYVQSTDVSDARFLRFIPDFVTMMKRAVDKANR